MSKPDNDIRFGFSRQTRSKGAPEQSSELPGPGQKKTTTGTKGTKTTKDVEVPATEDPGTTQFQVISCSGKQSYDYPLKMVLGLVICLFLITGTYGKVEDAYDRVKMLQNYGVLLKDQGTLYPAADHWTHFFELELSIYPFMDENPSGCFNCAWYSETVKEIVALHQQTRLDVGSIIARINAVLPHHNLKGLSFNRRRRSFLPFIGQIASSLFGTATNSDLNALSRNMAKIRASQQKMAKAVSHQIDTFVSAINNFDVRLTNTFQAVQDNHDAIRLLGENFNRSLISAETAQAQLLATVIKQTRLALRVITRYEELLMGVLSSLQGKLSPLLVPEDTLSKVLNYIAENTNPHGFYLTHPHPTFYYQNAKFIIFRQFSSVFIAVHFPVTAITTRIYSVHSFPIPLNSSTNHATELHSNKKYLVVSSDKQIHAELDDDELQSCVKNNHVWQCQNHISFQRNSRKSCFLSLFSGNILDIDKYCVFHFVQDALTEKILEINVTHFLMINTSNITLTCENSVHKSKGCTFCIISIPCKCTFQTQSLYLPARWNKCTKTPSKEITMVHAVNLILLQQFFNSSLQDFSPNSTFSKVLDVKVPHFQLFTHNFSKLVAPEQKARIDIKKISENAKKDKVTFQSLSETILDNQSKFKPQFDFALTFAIISTVIATLCFLSFVFIFRKYRTLAATVAVLYKAHKISSLPIFHYTRKLTTSTTEAPYSIPLSHVYSTSEVLGTLAVIVLVLYTIFRLCKSQKFKLVLEISNEQSTVIIPIRTIPYAHYSLSFFASHALEEFKVTFGLRSKLHIDWAGLTVSVSDQGTQWHLPNTININPILAYRTHKIISTPFNVFLYKQIGSVLYPITVRDLPEKSATESLYPSLS